MALESPLRPFPTNNWSAFSLIFSMSFSVLAEEMCTSHLPLANTPKSVMKFLRLHRNDGYFLSAIYSLPRCASCLISRRVCRMKCLLFFCSLLVKYLPCPPEAHWLGLLGSTKIPNEPCDINICYVLARTKEFM